MSELRINKISPRKGTTTTITDSGDTVTLTSGTNLNNAGILTVNTFVNSGTITSTGTLTVDAINNTNSLTTAGFTGATIDNSSGSVTNAFVTGNINWQASDIKTAAFTAEASKGYFCNTTSGSFLVTFPASPSAGDVIGLKDYLNTFDTNNLTISGNGNNIQGIGATFTASVEGASLLFIYVDATRGWILSGGSKASDILSV